MKPGKLYSATEAARELGVSRSQLHVLLHSGALKGFRVGKGLRAAWAIPVEAVAAYAFLHAARLAEKSRR